MTPETMPPKLLPLNDPTFAEIRNPDKPLLYADKTQYIYELLRSNLKNFFLSRPRRFGKSLLLSTIKELFVGDPKIFEGLWIAGEEVHYVFPRHPVLHLSLSVSSTSSERLEANIIANLSDIAKKSNLDVMGDSPDIYFGRLIKALYESTNSKVVILVDEYDAPVTRMMEDQKIAKSNAKVLHDFFAILKAPDVVPCIHFTMVTGITRYALTSMDSGANHLNDISLNPKYGGICGFLRDELVPLFADRLETTLSELKIKGIMKPSDGQKQLIDKIHFWY
ncbi:MAG: AAA family ATPase, partial [Deltaproteobacteria bacterium]|nr:AAA family ATPase [Deltaproteobacteria bacterium]